MELYIANPNNIPINVYSRSRSSAAEGLNHKQRVSSLVMNIPTKKNKHIQRRFRKQNKSYRILD